MELASPPVNVLAKEALQVVTVLQGKSLSSYNIVGSTHTEISLNS